MICRVWPEYQKGPEAPSGDLPCGGERQFLIPLMLLTSTARLQPLALQRKPRVEKFHLTEGCWGVSLWRVVGSGSVMEGACREQRGACVFKSPYVVLGINTKYTEGLFF